MIIALAISEILDQYPSEICPGLDMRLRPLFADLDPLIETSRQTALELLDGKLLSLPFSPYAGIEQISA